MQSHLIKGQSGCPVGDRLKKLDVDVVDSFVLITFGGRTPANQVRLAVYPIIYDGF